MDRQEWKVIAQFSGSDGDLETNLLIARLTAEGIQATRFPFQAPATIMAGVSDQPIIVLVPEAEVAAAQAILADYEADTPE